MGISDGNMCDVYLKNRDKSFVESLKKNANKFYNSFFDFIGKEPIKDIFDYKMTEQVEIVIRNLYEYFEKIYGSNDKSRYDIIIQEMVYGNRDKKSLTGMCYTRNPYTGEKYDYGSFLLKHQGICFGGKDSPEEIDLSEMKLYNMAAYEKIIEINKILEEYYKDIRMLEYTAEGDDLYILQNTVGNRTYDISGEF